MIPKFISKKKFSFFGERGDPYAQKRQKLIPTFYYKFGYHSNRLDEKITNKKLVLLKNAKIFNNIRKKVNF